MNDVSSMPAQARERVGKGAARKARAAGYVPGVIYGDKKPARPVILERRVLLKELHRGGFLNRLYELQIEGSKEQVLPRDVQLDPVTDFPTHVDFLRLGKGSEINIMVPVHFLDEEESEGLKRGGVLNIVRHEIEFMCPADAIPESIEISLAGRDIGDSIHISEVTLPAGVTPIITDRDFTIATIAAPTVVAEEAAEEAAEAAEEAEAAEGAEGAEGEAEGGEAAESEESSE
jgi:large subunit ribosomal protein L25